MESPDDQHDAPDAGARPEGDLGEDHRDGPPGYDLDEQAAIERLERERDSGQE